MAKYITFMSKTETFIMAIKVPYRTYKTIMHRGLYLLLHHKYFRNEIN